MSLVWQSPKQEKTVVFLIKIVQNFGGFPRQRARWLGMTPFFNSLKSPLFVQERAFCGF